MSTAELVSATGKHHPLVIGTERRPASGRASITVHDPSDQTVVGTVADATIQDAIDAMDAATGAAPGWRSTPPRARAEVLRRCYELMAERREELALLITRENGKTLGDARAEVDYAAEFFRWNSEEAVRAIGESSMAPSGAHRIVVDHEPVGVCVLVTPWNFPAAMATRKLAPALAAGCTAVLKPAQATPLTACAIVDLMRDAGVPPGVVNLVTTSANAAVVAALMDHPRARMLSFTGSTEVGSELLRQAARRVLRCSMELGGNAPLIVLDDADLSIAVEQALVAKMRNGGQACTAANRMYVHDTLHDAFARQLAARMAALRVGPGADEETGCGPVINDAAVTRINGLVADAVDQGASLLAGGTSIDGAGCYVQPTVLANVPGAARVMREEIFGPVAAIAPFSTVDEVVERANATEHGLAAYVFSRDVGRAMSLAGRLETGMVAVNRGVLSEPAAPFGGVKASGLGREGGHHGLLEFLEPKYVAVSWPVG